MKYLTAVVLFIAAVFFSGCGSAPRAVSGGWMESSVEMSDSGAVYDLWLMARVRIHECPDSLKLDIRITSPDGRSAASDTFTMPMNRTWIDSLADERLRYASSEFSCDVECLCRTGIHPVQYGSWLISCRADDPSVTAIQARVEKQE